MSCRVLTLAAGAAASVLVCSPRVLAAEPSVRQVQVINQTRHALVQVLTAPARSPVWRDDALGDAVAPPGKGVLVAVPLAGGCRFDIRVVLDDGRALTKRGVDVCTPDAVRFTE